MPPRRAAHGPALGDDDPASEKTGAFEKSSIGIPAHTLGSNPFNLENPSILDIAPAEPKSLEDTGLKMQLLADIALKYFYYSGTATGVGLAQEMRLPWTGVVERVVDFVAQEKLCDLRGGKGFGRASVDFALTEKGREYARDAIGRNTYVGPAPVPIEQYNALITSQTQENPVISKEDLAMGISHLTVR